MKEYHKIQTVYLRDLATKHKTLVEGSFSLPEFEYLQNADWEFTEKVDGTNVRIDWDGKQLRFGGKTDNAQMPLPLIERLYQLFPEEKFAAAYPDHALTLYGEGYGPKIQKGGGNYGERPEFVLFDVWCGCWLEPINVKDIAFVLDIKVVPIIGRGPLKDAIEMARAGFNSQWGAFQAEGIVMRPRVGLMTRHGDRIISKIKCRDFRR